jgi:hypothetical protein
MSSPPTGGLPEIELRRSGTSSVIDGTDASSATV